LVRKWDILGFRGWCITGTMPRIMMPVFRETILKVVPYAAGQGVQRIHLWGVIYPVALGELLWMCKQFKIQLSTDGMGSSLYPTWGQWGYGDWRVRHYVKPPLEQMGAERARHVDLTRRWLSQLSNTRYYRKPRFSK
jgi:hypothetical protein